MQDIMQNILTVSVIILAATLAYQWFRLKELEEMTLKAFKAVCKKIFEDQEKDKGK